MVYLTYGQINHHSQKWLKDTHAYQGRPLVKMYSWRGQIGQPSQLA